MNSESLNAGVPAADHDDQIRVSKDLKRQRQMKMSKKQNKNNYYSFVYENHFGCFKPVD